jgi:hypothetical protein
VAIAAIGSGGYRTIDGVRCHAGMDHRLTALGDRLTALGDQLAAGLLRHAK